MVRDLDPQRVDGWRYLARVALTDGNEEAADAELDRYRAQVAATFDAVLDAV